MRRRVNRQLEGQVFGRLQVTSYDTSRPQVNRGKDRPYWICNCSCGNTKSIREDSLLQRLTNSCGCLVKEIASRRSRIDLSGKKFGKLSVQKMVGPNQYGCIVWLCLCDCGNCKEVAGAHLRARSVSSCGCLVKLPGNLAIVRDIYRNYADSAKKRNLDFAISIEQFLKIIDKPCIYCGLESSMNQNGANGNYLYNGIDRVNNNIGYIINNIVSCCKVCNHAKKDMPIDDFMNYLDRITSFSRDTAKTLLEQKSSGLPK